MEGSSTISRSRTATADSSALDDDATGSHQMQQQQQQLFDGGSSLEPGSEEILDDGVEEEDPGPSAEVLSMHADSVESLWDVLEGYGIIKPKTGTRPQPPPLPDPADVVEDDVYAEGYKAEDFHAPEHDDEEEEAPTNPFLDDLPEVLEEIDDLVDAKVHELCENLYHNTHWNKAKPILDELAVRFTRIRQAPLVSKRWANALLLRAQLTRTLLLLLLLLFLLLLLLP